MTSAFYFQNETILPSPRDVETVFEFAGNVASTANLSPTTHLFTFRPSFTGLAVGDRITIERTAGRDAYGFTTGTVSTWRGTIAHLQSVPGSPSQTALRLNLDNDSDALPNVAVIDNIAANSVDRWRIIKMTGQIIPALNQWYLINTADNAPVNADVLLGRLWSSENLHRLAIVKAVNTPLATTSAKMDIGILRANPSDIRAVPIGEANAYMNGMRVRGIGANPTYSALGEWRLRQNDGTALSANFGEVETANFLSLSTTASTGRAFTANDVGKQIRITITGNSTTGTNGVYVTRVNSVVAVHNSTNVTIADSILTPATQDGGNITIEEANASEVVANVYGAGSDNGLATIGDLQGGVSIPSGNASLFPTGATGLIGLRLYVNQTHYLNANPAQVAKTKASALFAAEANDMDIFFPDGWQPPFWRAYDQWTAVNESGYVVSRHIKPKPASMTIPLHYITPTQALSTTNTLIEKLQRNFFLFAYRKGAYPLYYGWTDDTGQPQFVAPNTMMANINAMGYFRY